jgi:hypothetical protein
LKLNRILFLLSVLVIIGCAKESKKPDFVARINDSYLTREEFASLVDTLKLSPIDKERFIRDWLYHEMLFQKAKDRKILEREDYKNILTTSSKELAAAILLNDYLASEDINFTDSDLLEYYEKNKNYFQLTIDSYLINKVTFNAEDKAIKFRSLSVESDWIKASKFFRTDSSLLVNINSELIQENNLYPVRVMKIAKDLYPQEISIVIAENGRYYSVIQLIGKFDKGTIPSFEIIKEKVKSRFVAEKKKKLIDDYIKELYSKNDIEIKK